MLGNIHAVITTYTRLGSKQTTEQATSQVTRLYTPIFSAGGNKCAILFLKSFYSLVSKYIFKINIIFIELSMRKCIH